LIVFLCWFQVQLIKSDASPQIEPEAIQANILTPEQAREFAMVCGVNPPYPRCSSRNLLREQVCVCVCVCVCRCVCRYVCVWYRAGVGGSKRCYHANILFPWLCWPVSRIFTDFPALHSHPFLCHHWH
jgi:hypothetical protein